MRLLIVLALAALAALPALADDEARGAVRVLVHDDRGAPALGSVRLVGDGAAADAVPLDEDGHARLEAAAGAHELVWEHNGVVVRVPVEIVAGVEVDLFVRADARGFVGDPADARREGPTAAVGEAPAAENSDAAPAARVPLTVRVVDEDGAPVAAARVLVRGVRSDRAAGGAPVTDEVGLVVVQVPVGPVSLPEAHPRHQSRSVELPATPSDVVTVTLPPPATSLEELQVRAPHLAGGLAQATAERQNANRVVEVLSAEQMSKAGDSDAAAALRRATGLTLVGGRYVIVRGLGERYVSTLLDGGSLPSPEPERRVVPLDLFPSSFLQSVVVEKTWMPDLPGEFGGGVISLVSRKTPEQGFLAFSLSGSALFDSTFTTAPTTPGGSLDLLGLDDGTRALPADLKEATRDGPLVERSRFSDVGFTAKELQTFGEAMPRRYLPVDGVLPPGFGLSAAAGDVFTLGPATLGATVSLTFGNDWLRRSIDRTYLTVGQGGALEEQHVYRFESSEHSTSTGALLSSSLSLPGDQELTLVSVFNRSTEDEARVYQGRNRDVGGDIRVARLRLVERTLWSSALSGEHPLPWAPLAESPLSLSWRYGYALALRNEPGTIETRYDEEGQGSGLYLLSDRPEGNQRLDSELVDHSHDVATALTLPFTQWFGLLSNVKVGLQASYKGRSVDTRRFKFIHKGPLSGDTAVRQLAPEDVFVPGNIGPEGFQFEEVTRDTDAYSGQILIGATHAGVTLPLLESLTFSGGLRLEAGRMDVTTFNPFSASVEPIVSTLSNLDVLPGGSLTWRFLPSMQLRAAGAVTVTRPELRELSPATFNDVTGGRQVFGNPDLKRGLIGHADLRWEWYLSGTESLSAALFYKHFDDPIETVVIPGAQLSVSYQNADSADNVGAELEGRSRLGFAHDAAQSLGLDPSWNFATVWLEDIVVGGNAALIGSRVVLPEGQGVQTSKERPLEGQSPWVLNAQLGYEPTVDSFGGGAIASALDGTSVLMLYNVFGPRIVEVGASGAPDAYEQPFHQLDIVASVPLRVLPRGAGSFKLAVRAQNLIDLPVTRTQGDIVTESYRRGRGFSLALSWAL